MSRAREPPEPGHCLFDTLAPQEQVRARRRLIWVSRLEEVRRLREKAFRRPAASPRRRNTGARTRRNQRLRGKRSTVGPTGGRKRCGALREGASEVGILRPELHDLRVATVAGERSGAASESHYDHDSHGGHHECACFRRHDRRNGERQAGRHEERGQLELLFF